MTHRVFVHGGVCVVLLRSVSLCGVLVLCSVSLTAENLLTNPSLEEVGEDGIAVGWQKSGSASLVTGEELARTGERAAKVRFDDRYVQSLKVEGEASYRITGYVRRAQPGGTDVPKIKVYFLDAAGQRADVQATEFEDVAADEYLRFDTVVRAPEAALEMNLALCGMFQADEWFYYDDLSVEQVEAVDWPTWEKTPDLNGMTVTVPDIADVWTDALLRIPPNSLVPIDGLLDTGVESQGKDLTVLLHEPIPINYVLVHTMKPMRTLGQARFWALDPAATEPFVETTVGEALVTSERFDEVAVSRLRVDIPDDAKVLFSEVQAFGLAEGQAELPGEPVEMPLSVGDLPPGMNSHLNRHYAREEDRAAYLAVPATSGPQPENVELPAGRYVNVIATPADRGHGLSGLGLQLSLATDEPESKLEICLKQVEELDLDIRYATLHDRGAEVLAGAPAANQHSRQCADIFRIVTRVRAGQKKLAVTFDIPDTAFIGAEPMWITLRPSADMTLDLGASRVRAHVTPSRAAFGEYVPRLTRLVRRMYSDASEAHAYDGRRYTEMLLGRYIHRLLVLDPDTQPATQILNRVAKRKAPVELTRPGPEDAPAWAVWERLALQNMHGIITWWLDNRQQADGQLAGHINDDGEFSCNWPGDYLITGDERVREGLRLLAEVAWRMSDGKGYTVGSRDVEHAAEDQSCTQPQMLLVEYGDPKHVERMMVMSQYLDFWTAINDVGRRQFKSFMFTADKIWDEPPNDVDHAYCPLAMVGAGHLVWYADIPELRKIVLEEADSWAAACMSTDKGKPKGKIPGEIQFRNSEILPYVPYDRTNPVLKGRNDLYMGGAGQYIVQYLLQGAEHLADDPRFAEPLHVNDPTDEQIVQRAQNVRASFQVADLSEGSWNAQQSETQLYEAWKVTGDKTWLVEELRECVRQQERSRWLLTEAEPYTDRIPYPGRTLLPVLYLGAATSGKSHVPAHWVSWEGGGTDFAALILEARPDRLKALVYSFADTPRNMKMRLWRLPHGQYDVAMGVDRNGDDEIDETIAQQRSELARGDAVEFSAPPGETVVLELRLVEELDRVTARPDLAVGPDDVTTEGGSVKVTVHNIGAAAAPESAVELRNAEDKVIAKARVPPLEAPLDLKPKTAEVTLASEGATVGGCQVVVDPADTVKEITEVNNVVSARG